MRRCNCRCNSRCMNCNSNNNCRCRNCTANNSDNSCRYRNSNTNNSDNSCSCRNSNTNNSDTCGCHMYANRTSQNNNVFPENYLYGYAYTPNQCMNRTFSPEVGLQHGTIFPELVSPYCPGQSIDFIEYLRNGGM